MYIKLPIERMTQMYLLLLVEISVLWEGVLPSWHFIGVFIWWFVRGVHLYC